MDSPFISICIPAYKRIEFLKRLLESIAIQTFRDFEVVVTDDSPGTDVQELCKAYAAQFQLYYYKNPLSLGTPENWNESVRKAKGEWIKLMHDDDWFASPGSLQQFARAVEQNPGISFFFSAYQNVYDETGKTIPVFISGWRKKRLERNPVTLFSSNVIGPPSVILVRNTGEYWYDPNIKWVVDIEFYIRVLLKYKPVFINIPLVNVGINKEQVTQTAFRVQEVEIPENFYLLEKTGVHHLKNILIYDAWWRSIRNLDIRSEHTVRKNGYEGKIPEVIKSMIGCQKRLPRRLLMMGAYSKIIMTVHFLFNRHKIS